MAYRADIVQRGETVDDRKSRYKWNWHWLDKVVTVQLETTPDEKVEVRYGEWLRKLKEPGLAYCELCRKEIAYGSQGAAQLQKHVETSAHLDHVKSGRLNPVLPGKCQISLSSFPSLSF